MQADALPLRLNKQLHISGSLRVVREGCPPETKNDYAAGILMEMKMAKQIGRVGRGNILGKIQMKKTVTSGVHLVSGI